MTATVTADVEVTMPQLGETVTEGTVTRWLRQVGDRVAEQEPLLEIATDKVDTEIPSPAAGLLAEIVVGEDETVSVGTVVGRLSTGATPAPPPVAATPAASNPAPTPHVWRHRHSPRVRRLAREAGLDLAAVHGTGPNGRVRPEDVLQAVHNAEQPAPPAADESWTTGRGAVVGYLSADVDVTALPDRERDALLVALVAAELLRCARRYLAGSAPVALLVDGLARGITDDLTPAAIRRMLADDAAPPPSTSNDGAQIALWDDTRLQALRHAHPVPQGCLLSISVSASTEWPVVVRSGATTGIGVGRRATLTVAYDASATPADRVAQLLHEIVTGIGNPAAVAELDN